MNLKLMRDGISVIVTAALRGVVFNRFYLLSYFLMTFTAQALLSLSFLACAPLQQASIFVAEDVKIQGCFCSENKTSTKNKLVVVCMLRYLPASFCFLNSPFAL